MQMFFVASLDLGIQKAKELIYRYITNKTVLFLSGGSTPKSLYALIAQEKKIRPIAAAMVDERFGNKWHGKSNERMIKQSGLLDYLQKNNIPWHPILQNKEKKNYNQELVSQQYDKIVRELLFHFPASIAIMGIGADGHTAGLPVQNSKFSDERVLLEGSPQDSFQVDGETNLFKTDALVVSYNDSGGIYGQRITMTFTALSMIDELIVLAFGQDKKQVLEKIFTPGSLEEIPARFYNRPEISRKTILITDQRIN